MTIWRLRLQWGAQEKRDFSVEFVVGVNFICPYFFCFLLKILYFCTVKRFNMRRFLLLLFPSAGGRRRGRGGCRGRSGTGIRAGSRC